MSEYDSVPEEVKISKINSAGLINLRMHNLWEDANKHKRTGEFSKWNGDLDAIWCELVGDVDEGKEDDENFKKLNEVLGKCGILMNWNVKQDGFSSVNQTILLSKAKQYQALLLKEAFLRRLQNTQGKGTAYAEESDWD
tara:strand:- start:116 stop:532 length:417 start_codon:yes stop_codon:yes gene_type:complete